MKFPLADQRETSLLVWTTTPWTLPNNQFVAVHPEMEYAEVVDDDTGERLILASPLVEAVAQKAKPAARRVGLPRPAACRPPLRPAL